METSVVEEPPWEQLDEEDEEGLTTRRKHLNQTPINGDLQEQEHQEEVKHFGQQNGINIHEDGDENEDKKEKQEERPDYCVYYDTQKGNRLHSENGVSDTNINVETTNHDKENGEHLKQDNLSFEEVDKNLVSQGNNKRENTEIEVIKDGDGNDEDEATEYDVETVLKKQDTHDLYCPNCNSCITKRVILRKRKRRIRIDGEDAKRNKPETLIPSEKNVGVDDSNNDQALSVVDLGLNDAQGDEDDHDVFRCLSCFSIFMPTGNGFKLFRIFGTKSDERSKKEVGVKKGWFSSIFASDKMEPLNNQANEITSVGFGAIESLDGSNSNINNNNDNNNNTESKGRIFYAPSVGGNDNATSLTPRYDIIEERVVDESDNAIKKSNGGNAFAFDTPEAGNGDRLLTSYNVESNEKSDYPGTFVVNPPVDSVDSTEAENAISSLQHDGLKLVVPPNVGSLVIDNSQMNQKLDVTVKVNSPDISPEVSQQRFVQNNVEIDLKEPLLKVDKGMLTDKQIKLRDDFKNIKSTTAGNDAIITIESKQLDASTLQRSPDTSGVTALQQVESALERGSTTTATEGRSLDVIKSIVYGGLMESIASLSVVSSAAGADAATPNVLALGLANIFGGLFVLSHDLWDLKNERTRGSSNEDLYEESRYRQLLGQKVDFPLHMFVCLSAYLVFGLLPPLVYGFSFRASNNKDMKLLTVVVASVLCIMILAAGKAYVQRPRKSYLKTIAYYVVFGFMVSGVSFVFGDLIMKLLEKLHIFPPGSVVNLNVYGASSHVALAVN